MTIAAQLTDINNSKQAIKTAIESQGVTVGTAPFDQYAGFIENIESGGGDEDENPWYRNPSWLELPQVLATESKAVGLHLLRFMPKGSFDDVYNVSNWVAVVATVNGGFTVSWGDGTSTNHNSGAVAYKLYNSTNMDNVSNDTRAPVTFTAASNTVNRTAHGYKNGMNVSFAEITTTTGIDVLHDYYVVEASANNFKLSRSIDGTAIAFTNDGSGFILPYKQVIITITPQTVNNHWSNINFYQKHNQAGLQNSYATGWLDLVISGPSLSSLSVSGSGATVTHSNLQQCQLISDNSIFDHRFMFHRCFNLQSVPNYVLRSTATCIMNNMFQSCLRLTHAPLFTNINGAENAARITNMDTMFRFCRSLKFVPNYNSSSCTNFNTMLGDCSSLERAPMLNTGAAAMMINMFFGSENLKYVPDYNTSTCTAMGEIFRGCGQLSEFPAFDRNNVNSAGNLNNQVFQCSSLIRHRGTGAKFTHTIANCQLSAPALDEYYTGLPTVTDQTLTVTGNWGTAAHDPTIATAKGWTVTV